MVGRSSARGEEKFGTDITGLLMQLTGFEPSHITLVVEAWNRWLPAQYHIDARLLQQLTFNHQSWRLSRATLAWQDGELVGFLLGRDWQHWIVVDALVVNPDCRRQGIGTKLLERLGKRPLRIGGGPSHFVPGVPEDWQEGRDFLSALGLEQDWTAEDLYLKLERSAGPFTSCSAQDQEKIVDMVRSEFSQRWTNDTIARFTAGDAADVVIIKDGAEPVAFCQCWHYESSLLGPSVFWLRNDCGKFGGIGPVGVKESHRGRGLGLRIVDESLNYLASRGVEEVVVDWTSIGPFYEKLGFKSWKKYSGIFRGELTHL